MIHDSNQVCQRQSGRVVESDDSISSRSDKETREKEGPVLRSKGTEDGKVSGKRVKISDVFYTGIGRSVPSQVGRFQKSSHDKSMSAYLYVLQNLISNVSWSERRKRNRAGQSVVARPGDMIRLSESFSRYLASIR